MTNKSKNWERLIQVINRFRSSVNSFAHTIGLGRSENLYHIRKGNYGISEDLANRITKLDSEIDRTWLLSGVGAMLKSEAYKAETLPFYSEEMEEILPNIENHTPRSNIVMPYITHSDFVVRTFSKPMSDPTTAANDLFLKRLASIDDVVQGNEHVLLVNDEIIWRRVRYIKNDPSKWRLVSRNRLEHPDLIVNVADVKMAWRVVIHIAILES